MKTDYNKIVIALIIFLTGVFSLTAIYFGFDYKYILPLVAGAAFLLLYKTKSKTWALIPGIYMLYFGICCFLLPFGVGYGNLFVSMFFAAPGIIFIVLYFKNLKRLFLNIGAFLLSIGIFFIIAPIYIGNLFFLFIGCIGINMLVKTVFLYNCNIKFKGYFAVVMILIGFWRLLIIFIPLLLISIFILFAIVYFKNKSDKQ